MRPIDADFLIDCIKSQMGTGEVLFDEVMKRFIGILDKTPTIDAVSVVRCKECKWYEGDIMANPWGVCCHNGWVGGHIGHDVSENGWCYRAEKMEVEHD